MFLIFSSVERDDLLGRWKLGSYEAFYNILTSESFLSGSDKQIESASKAFEFALANTCYDFKIDTVFFTDAAEGIVKNKTGKWVLEKDTLVIFDYGKIKTYKFLISEISDSQMKMYYVFPGGIVGKSSLVFTKFNNVNK